MPIARVAGMVAVPLLWAAHLLAIYVFTALACARGFADLRWLGVGIVRWGVASVTVVALVALFLLVRPTPARLSGLRFEPWLAAGLGGLAAVAMLWEALPALWMRPCG